MTAQSGASLEEMQDDRESWGHLVESAVGAHLANAAAAGLCELFYWRERNREVDFVVKAGRTVVAIEVKSGRVRTMPSGREAFRAAFRTKRTLLVGDGGIALEDFLIEPVARWLEP